MQSAFLGDSIFYGYQTDYSYKCWKVFEKESGLSVVSENGENPAGFPGAGIFDLINFCDTLFSRYEPDILFICIGANHFDSRGILRWPFGISEKVFFDAFSLLFRTLSQKETRIVWTGLPPFENGGFFQERSLELSREVSKRAEDFGIESVFFTKGFIESPHWNECGGIYYNNLYHDIHPNYKGQEFIGRFLAKYYIEKIKPYLFA
ncbi:MAG: hypothetical protein CSB21_02850 [Deltaproteobacteria bacterium]|nr:MAG: hypothetical protein CSB21_02850 [Deltaproteobacteria bacterium]